MTHKCKSHVNQNSLSHNDTDWIQLLLQASSRCLPATVLVLSLYTPCLDRSLHQAFEGPNALTLPSFHHIIHAIIPCIAILTGSWLRVRLRGCSNGTIVLMSYLRELEGPRTPRIPTHPPVIRTGMIVSIRPVVSSGINANHSSQLKRCWSPLATTSSYPKTRVQHTHHPRILSLGPRTDLDMAPI